MKMIVGVLLILVGVAMFVYKELPVGFNEHRVISPGGAIASTESTETVPLSPIVGGAAVAGGLILLAAGAYQKD